jgi:hypothetical protein
MLHGQTHIWYFDISVKLSGENKKEPHGIYAKVWCEVLGSAIV